MLDDTEALEDNVIVSGLGSKFLIQDESSRRRLSDKNISQLKKQA